MIWKLDLQRQADVYTQAGEQNGLPPQAIEKDWWVTQCLKAIFSSDEGRHLIFKGATSLSKGWGLIERFSEDIDLAISRERLGRLRQENCRSLGKYHICCIFEEFIKNSCG